ncbi:DUF4213 domain-containing protein [Gracilinema caldarium]|uniref:DUF4213 domain-containing protein n=1 Tax=Gracilinema caldarium TaxID=215591 RepID=UPI00031B2F64|nr:DUF4213 domain-containing protein [Gracilinema caldarium]
MNPEALHKALIADISADISVLEAFSGASHSIVITEAGIGSVMTLDPTGRSSILPTQLTGMPLRNLAEAVLSWNAADAALDAAALNAYYNSPEILKKTLVLRTLLRNWPSGSIPLLGMSN